MVRGIVVAGLVAASACQFPRPADVPSDASVDAPIDARPDLVTGRIVTRHVTPSGIVDTSEDASLITPQAWIPNGSGYTVATGVARTDGTFEITDVPAGTTFLLKLGKAVFVTDQHDLLLVSSTTIRADARPATMATPVTVTLSDAPSLTANDHAVLSSSIAGAGLDLATEPGQNTIAGQYDWFAAGANLPDGAAGDDLQALIYRTTATGPSGGTTDRILAAATIADPTIHDGLARTIAGAFAVPATTFTTGGRPNLNQFATGHSPLTRPYTVTITCAALPAAAGPWPLSGVPFFDSSIVTITQPLSASVAPDPSPATPDPFPAAWPRFCAVNYQRPRQLLALHATATTRLSEGTYRVGPPDQIALAPLAPPTTLSISGHDGEAGGLLRNDGSDVAVSWTGSSQATQYQVVAFQVRNDGGMTRAQPVLFLTTQETDVTIPADFLGGSEAFAFMVVSQRGSNDYAHGQLYFDGIPGTQATATTAMFRWSATCGDHVVDVGEDCDDGAATATCDSDCTTRTCGDGVRNVVAGELCDSIVDTPGCDSDCTANMCGDGHLNDTTEQCDDGNPTPGDGCSATCTTE